MPALQDDDVEIQPELAEESSPESIIGIFWLKYALSQNAMKTLLEILRLKLDVSGIASIDNILKSATSAPVNLHTCCSNCQADLELGGCFDYW